MFLPLELSYCAATDYKYSHLIVSLEIIFFFSCCLCSYINFTLPFTLNVLIIIISNDNNICQKLIFVQQTDKNYYNGKKIISRKCAVDPDFSRFVLSEAPYFLCT